MTSQIFRKVALDRLSSPEQLDLLMHVTGSKSWLALAGLAGLLLTAVLWSIFSRMPVEVAGPVIFLPPGGMQNIISLYGGQVSDLTVSSGSLVEAGQVIAHVKSIGQDAVQPVLSPYNGRVVELKTNEGYLIEPGAPIVSLEPVDDQVYLEAVAYLSRQDARRLSPGLAVKLAPETALPEEYGFLIGQIVSIDSFPSSWSGIVASIGNEELASMIANSDAPVKVRIALLEDAATPTGLAWTSAAGPDFSLTSGTLGQANIVIGWQRPIELLFSSR